MSTNSSNPIAYTLQILHTSNIESGTLTFHEAINFTALVDAFEDQYSNSITLATGDNFLPGPIFYAGEDFALQETLTRIYRNLTGAELNNLVPGGGRLDITLMNLIGFDASGLGNHEFDLGTSTLAGLIGADVTGTTLSDIRWLGAQFPYLATNLDFSNDSRLKGLATTDILSNTAFNATPEQLIKGVKVPKLAPATIINEGGEQIGVLSVSNPLLREITQAGGVQVIGGAINTAEALASVLQPTIDSLTNQGINKIILISDLPSFQLERSLTNLLNGIDVVVSGSGDSFLADSNDVLRPGDTPTDTYPFLTTDVNGNPSLIVKTNAQYNYLGRLAVNFDANGILLTDTLDDTVNGVYATTDENVASVWEGNDPYAEGTKGALAQSLLGSLESLIALKDSNIYGYTDVALNGDRNTVRTQETNLGNLFTDANLAAARRIDPTVAIALQNAGSIRGSFEPGAISQLDVETILRFNNPLTLVTITASELKTVLENGVSQSATGLTPARFPQISGLKFSFDTTDSNGNPIPVGQRVQNVALTDTQGNIIDVVIRDGQVVGNADRPIRVATLEFLANGGDGYPFPSLGENPVSAGIGEQQAFKDYISENFASTPYALADTPIGEDIRIQNLDFRSDTIIPDNPIVTVNDTFTRIQNQPISLTAASLLGNDLNLNGLPLSLVAVDDAVNGTVSLNKGKVIFNPDAGFYGAASFDYTVTDGTSTNTGIVSLNVTPFTGTNKANVLKGTAFADTLIGLQGKDTLTGGGGGDRFVYTSITDAGDTIKDFVAGQDKIDLSEVLDRLGCNSSDPIDEGYVRFVGQHSNTQIQLDPDGLASITPKSFILVQGVDASTLGNPDNFIF